MGGLVETGHRQQIASSAEVNLVPHSMHLNRDAVQTYLTQCINQMGLESDIPHTIVNLLFQLVIVNNKLKIWWGG